jgi:transcriptional regulator NrdR family protein
MLCPKCGGKTKVTDSRATDDKVYRKRMCSNCNHEWATAEAECRLFEFRMVRHNYYLNAKERSGLNG